MKNREKFYNRFKGLIPILTGVLAVAGLLTNAQPASAQTCMDDRFPGSLNCTANDVVIAKATDICVPDKNGGCLETPTCISGSDVAFTANFWVQLSGGGSSQTRYDIGLYFGTDGDGNGDGALTGQCFVGVIDPTLSSLDGDSCGDISTAHNPLIVPLTITTKCTGDENSNLKLPNCVSWRQPGSNELCNSPTQAFPGSPSKCKCDKGFSIGIRVEHPSPTVMKKADPTSLPEPGGNVTYTVSVYNPAEVASVTLNSITEDDTMDGQIDASYLPKDICDKYVLAPGETANCTFKRSVLFVDGKPVVDEACVSGTDSFGGPFGPKCATASVSMTDVIPTATVTKTVASSGCPVIKFNVKVDNTDLAESLNLIKIEDSPFGIITDPSNANILNTNCSSRTISAGGSYECWFMVETCGGQDTVTATLSDNESNTITPSSSVIVDPIEIKWTPVP